MQSPSPALQAQLTKLRQAEIAAAHKETLVMKEKMAARSTLLSIQLMLDRAIPSSSVQKR
jgi:hypothetical protein